MQNIIVEWSFELPIQIGACDHKAGCIGKLSFKSWCGYAVLWCALDNELWNYFLIYCLSCNIYCCALLISYCLVSGKFSLFISYTHKDNTNHFARRLHNDLEQEGWDVFIDTEDIGIGDNLPERIVTAINNCHGMIVILTNNYTKSKWCPKEVHLAESKGKKLYPLFREDIDDDAKPSSIDLHINTTRLLYGNFCDDDKYEGSLQQLITCIRKV